MRLLAKDGELVGVIGKKAIHVVEPDERKKVFEIKSLWIDIGAKDGEEANGMVHVGDVGVIDEDLVFELPSGRLASAPWTTAWGRSSSSKPSGCSLTRKSSAPRSWPCAAFRRR